MDKARHAFGSSTGIEAAKEAGKIDAYDILFLDGGTEPKVGWLDANGETRIVDTEKVVTVEGDSLPNTGLEGKIYIFGEEGYFWNGTEFVNLCKPTDVTALKAEIDTKVTTEEVKTMIKESSDSFVEIVEF